MENLPDTVHGLTPAPSRASGAADPLDQPMSLETAMEGPERAIIEGVLKRNNYNRQLAAAEVNINRTTLYKKMRKYQLDKLCPASGRR